MTQVDPDLCAQTGTGSVTNPFQLPKNAPPPLVGPTGKPEVFYYGGEFCPNCAAERWSVIVAMSRFGTFSKLTETTSAASPESYPNTTTFTFAQSSYSSSYVDFVSVEASDRQHQPLQTPSSRDQKLVDTYDAPPYVTAQNANSIPFMDIVPPFSR